MNPDAQSQTRIGTEGGLYTYGGDDGLSDRDTKRATIRT